MKRTLILLAGAIALGTAIYVSNRVGAQTGGSGGVAIQPKTKVGLLNLAKVIKGYKKFDTYQADLRDKVKQYQLNDTAWKADGEKMAKEAALPTTTQAKRDELETKLKNYQRAIEDNKVQAQKVVMKEQETQLKTLYQDVHTVVNRYAAAHGFEMVLHYNDVVAEDEKWSPQNIARKMRSDALMPMYVTNGLDISDDIITTLNQGYSAPARPR